MPIDPNEDPRLRAARYRDGVDLEALATLADRALTGTGGAAGAARSSGPRQELSGHDLSGQEPDAGEAQDTPTPGRRGGEAARLAATLDVVARTAVDRAIAAGDFEHLAYAGKPLPEVVSSNDPDWWTKGLLRRERVHATEGMGPEALLLRVVDARLEEDLDALRSEQAVRTALEAFNRRVVEARRQLLGGPPVVTPTRDVEAEVRAWRERAERRRAATPPPAPPQRRTRRPWRRGRRGPQGPPESSGGGARPAH